MTKYPRLAADSGEDILKLAAVEDFTLEAAAEEGKLPTFKLLAYTGGPMQVSRWMDPVLVDLAGEIKARSDGQMPLLFQHRSSDPVGHIDTFEVTPRGIVASGVMSVPGESTDRICGAARNGYQWAASIGGMPTKVEYVEKGQTARVNGRTYQGPVQIVRAMEIHEISVVTIGADKKAKSNIAASAAGREAAMKFSEWLKANYGIDNTDDLTDERRAELQAEFDAIQAENKAPTKKGKSKEPAKIEGATPESEEDVAGKIEASRLAYAEEAERMDSINKICAEHGDTTLKARAIREGWTAEKLENQILRAQRNVSQQAPTAFSPRKGKLTAAAVAAAAGIVCGSFSAESVAASDGEQVAEVADEIKGQIGGLQDLIQIAAASVGVELPRGSMKSDDVIRAAFASHELVNVLGVAGHKVLLNAYRDVEQTWRKVAVPENVPNFHESKAIDLSGDGAWSKIGDSGEVPLGKLSDESYGLQPYTYGKVFKITRQQIYNDDLGAFLRVPQIIGRTGAQTVLRAFWAMVMANTGNFFHANNNNLLTGAAASALGIDALSAARAKFANQTSPDGGPMNAQPKVLIVPPSLYDVADTLFKSEMVVQSGGTSKNTRGATNNHRGKYEPVEVPELENSAVGVGNESSTAWYLAADPKDVTAFRIGFVRGVQEPQTRTAQQLPIGELGMAWEAVIDFGVGFGNPRGANKSTGAD